MLKIKKTKTELKMKFRQIIDEENEIAQFLSDIDLESKEYEDGYDKYINDLFNRTYQLFTE